MIIITFIIVIIVIIINMTDMVFSLYKCDYTYVYIYIYIYIYNAISKLLYNQSAQ